MITFDLEPYWASVGAIALSLAGFWAFKRVRALISGR